MIGVGIDAGSRAIKVVLFDSSTQQVRAACIVAQGIRQAELARQLFREALEKAGLDPKEVGCVVATGYGRNTIEFADTTVTEITCHARGVHHVMPSARTVLDIGGQDSKLLRLETDGRVRDFAMNDRCAAGTGRFLEVVAERLDVPLEDLGALARQSRQPAAISSMCVVFAETEIIGLLASGALPEDIVAGVQSAIASRMMAMAGGKVLDPVVFTGGVALIPGMDLALGTALEHPVAVVPQPQLTGALGAAIIACSQQQQSARELCTL